MTLKIGNQTIAKHAKKAATNNLRDDAMPKLGMPQMPLSPLLQLARYNAPRRSSESFVVTAKSFGELLKAVRKAQKLTQQQLADVAGVGRRFVVECEAGKPSLEFSKVLQVAAAAGIDIIAEKR